MKDPTSRKLAFNAIALGLLALALLLWADWRVAAGVLLFVWGNNAALRLQKRRDEVKMLEVLLEVERRVERETYGRLRHTTGAP